MSLSSWWKSLFKKKEPVRTEPWRVTPREESRPLPGGSEKEWQDLLGKLPDVRRRSDPRYLDRQGYPQGRQDYYRAADRDRQALRADRAELAADFASAEAALLRDELDEAHRRETRAEEELRDVRDDYHFHPHFEGDHASHLREDHEADQSAAETAAEPVDDRPILPNGAVDPTYTAYPPQPTPEPEQPKTDADFYGRDSDFYGTGSSAPAPDPTPAPSYDPPASYSAPDPTPQSYDSSPPSSDY